jgi:biopolymer transport protein ExbB/TolQ
MFQKGLEVLVRGGWVMVPLLLCALVSVAVMIERSIVLRRAAQDRDGLVDEVRDLLERGQTDDALALCQRTPGASARVVAAGIRNHRRSPRLWSAPCRKPLCANSRRSITGSVFWIPSSRSHRSWGYSARSRA